MYCSKFCRTISVAALTLNFTTVPADGADRTGRGHLPGATTPTSQMTLEAVVSDVLEHNPEVRFYRAEIAAAKGGARNRRDVGQSGTLHHHR